MHRDHGDEHPNLDTPRHVDDREEQKKYRHPISYQDERSRDAESGQLVEEENAGNHPAFAINKDKFWRWSPFMKQLIELGLEAEKGQDDDDVLNAASVNMTVLVNSLKRV